MQHSGVYYFTRFTCPGNMEDYLHGYCEYFAYALHQELGYPMYKVYDSEAETDMALVHVFCINPNSEYVDVRGVIPNIWDLIEPYEDVP